MRVALTIDGGFAYLPGLARPMVVDDAVLAPGDAARLRRLCAAALALGAAPEPPPAATMPDARRYRLSIDVAGATRALTATDPVGANAIAELISFVEEHGRR